MDALRTQFGTENSNKTFKEIFESSESRTDIIGYSAFYRTPTRKYGIGSLGDTLVYGNTTMPIKENQADAKKWIVDNLGKDSEPMKYVTKIL
ncbi:TPA: hypothetical protein DEP21_03460 [Patescibacteria group bacterium]|nr:hypothetical protein [Candidatus Gracilibacteria bacterium]